ncbi:DUF4055 domain-containing protein [Cronobacter sp. EKM101R]|uniref:DUF4055 domain-containing protein n=1 Tax=unclassified Cronobacter TaxID=2649764 RepID=UPI0013EA7877|nr:MULTISPECIES: DUF4055 domain-containing protein [unclassified Cronobacter]KAF6589813.1 DUF4055 domain-containing protein [Cronobacter sp. EKM101R]KAF6592876.1 DUF4055 domain-containing protein [Cronobacter sp. EKM102R]HDI3023591.1 DUF4055 domain-containing protein [Cronobacter turicensis]HDI3035668.1 DUF4055 domain-containing protein [Cronobacter turicensis]
MADLNIDFHHPAWSEFADEWQMVTDCVDGERAVKRKGKRRMVYLPHPSSDWQTSDPECIRYDAYLKRAPFLNATGRTLQGLLGIAFAKPLKIELTGALEVLAGDVDGQGLSLDQLARDAVSQSLQKGRAGILTDYTGSGEQPLARTGRPLLKLYKAAQIINWRVTNGKTSLVVLKEWEAVDLPDEFRLELRLKWTELRLIDGKAHVRIWKQSAEEGVKATNLAPIRDKAGKALTDLPWSWIGANNNDHTPDAPPLADIASMNIKHYQAEADIAEIAHLCGNPTPTAAGLSMEWADKYLKDGIRIGSTTGVLLPAGGKLEIVQAEDRNLPIVVAERREKQMAMLGAKLVERGTAARTATQAADEAQTDNSILSLCVGNVEAAINRALAFAAAFAGGSGTITINKRYEVAQLDSQAITALLAAVQSGKMLLVDFIRYMQSIGLVDPTVSPEEVETALRAQNDLAGSLNDGGDD